VKVQHRARGQSDDPTSRASVELYADVRPLPGIEFEELIGSPAAPRPRAPRWTVVVLALGAAAATMGLGGRLVGGSLGRNVDDRVAASPFSPSPAPAASPARVVVEPPAEPVGLPFGFAAGMVTSGPAGQRPLLVVGFVGRRQWISLRLIEPDGAILASAHVETRPPAPGPNAPGLQSFQAAVEVPGAARRGGPDSLALEISWSDDAGIGTVCTMPVGRPGVQARTDGALLVLVQYARCT